MRDYDVNETVEQPVEMRGYDREPEMELKQDYKPKKQELLKEYEIRLRFLSVGCVVSVGCKEIPFRNVKEAMDELNKYVENPYEVGKKWHELFNSED
jgi:hypothetical protein